MLGTSLTVGSKKSHIKVRKGKPFNELKIGLAKL